MGHITHHTRARTAALSLAVSSVMPAALLLTLPMPAAQAQTATRSDLQVFTIAPGSLQAALGAFGQASGLMIIYSAEDIAGKHSAGVQGRYHSREALTALLAGTGLQATPQPNGGYAVLPLPANSDTAVQLAPVSVIGRTDSVTTAGTGSYASPSVSLFKGATSLRDIPQSVSVLTRQQMDDQNLTTAAAALNQVTGVSTTGYDRTESIMVRGYTANAQADGVPVVGMTNNPFTDMALFDRVEVLRGPSGLLTGSGEPGGTVNFVRKRPSAELSGSGALSTGSHNRRRGEIDVNTPLNQDGSLRARAVLVRHDEHKFYHEAKSRDEVAYGIIEYDLTPHTTLGVSGTHSRWTTNTFWGLPLMSDGSLPSRRTFMGSDQDSVFRIKEVSADLTHRFENDWTARAAYGYRELDADYLGIVTTAPVDISTGRADTSSAYGYYQKTTKWDSADFNLSGPFSALGLRHRLTIGYNQSRSDNLLGSTSFSAKDRDVFHDHDYSAFINRNIVSRRQTVTQQSGLYTSAQIALADPLKLILGGRWTSYRSKSRTVAASNTDWVQGAGKASKKFTPYGGLIWDANDLVTLYASYADTFVPQTQEDYQGNVLDPRIGWQSEVGAKIQLLEDRLFFNLAFYRIRDKNRSMIDGDHIGCGSSANGACYRSAGLVQSDGIDLELVGAITPNWNISAGYTHTRAKYRSDSNSDNVGRRFNADLIPRQMFKLWTNYRFGPEDFGGALSGWSVGGGMHAQSDLYTSSARQGGVRHGGGYAIFSARVGYRINAHWDASLLVSNLFDRTYLRNVGYGGFLNFYGDPRAAILTLRGQF
ncbi:TonB-dependent siderophore receptor [Bordetella trematum]|uniref:TonB-dependent siderophore receptor n=1 Tax=Bordetella trematum TaxID=123899 RepID=UPI000D922455|nr:TonB-dependent siderophore receptor [Bordetella trematum]SPU48882.1 ferric-siderophore receptor [Bordetella trematum]VDH04614.1 Fe(III)-pyochelin receptor [Bordetella trematum]